MIPFQAGINTQLAQLVGSPIRAAFVSFVVGMLALLALSAFVMKPLPSGERLAGAPWWLWTGGLFGAFYVAGNIFSAPKLGAATPAGGAPGPGTTPAAADVLALQQSAGNAAVTGMLQRQSVQTQSGAYVGDKAGPTNNIREEVLPVMDRLHMLWSMSNDDYSDEYPKVGGKPPKAAIPPAEIPKTIASLKHNEEQIVDPPVADHFLGVKVGSRIGKGLGNPKNDVRVLQDGLKQHGVLDPADYFTENAVEPADPKKGLDDAKIPKTLAAIATFKQKAAAGTFRPDVFAGVKPVTAAQHTEVEAILAGPGATIVGGKVKLPDPMKGAGKGGKFEQALLKALDKYISKNAKAFQAQKKKGPS